MFAAAFYTFMGVLLGGLTIASVFACWIGGVIYFGAALFYHEKTYRMRLTYLAMSFLFGYLGTLIMTFAQHLSKTYRI